MISAMQRIDLAPLMTIDEAQQAALDEKGLMIQQRLSLAVLTKSRTELQAIRLLRHYRGAQWGSC